MYNRYNFYLKILKFFEDNLTPEEYAVCKGIFKLESCYNAAYVLAKEVGLKLENKKAKIVCLATDGVI